jgi:HlyD family secretion protein
MMQVTSPQGWLALAALGLAVAAGVIWSIVGTISIKVEGNGILMRGKAVLAVTSGSSGRLVEMLVAPGDNVKEGQAIARLGQPDLTLRIRSTEEELNQLIQQDAGQRRRQAGIIAQLQRQRDEQSETIRRLQLTFEKGIITQDRVQQAKRELTAIDERISQARLIDTGRANRIADMRRQLRQLESELEISTEIVSAYPGRVLEVTAMPGDLVNAGSRVITLESFEEPIEAVIFIPAADGKKVQSGMDVLISPSTVRAEEYGFIIGKVRDVSDYPMTSEGLLRILRNPRLVEELTGTSAPIEVSTDLIEDPDTPSGFRWSSSQGPPNRVYSGTLCSASVTVDKRRPISYVIPILKRSVGG